MLTITPSAALPRIIATWLTPTGELDPPKLLDMDLCLRYDAVTLGIELKVWRDGRSDPLAGGREQLDSYLSRLRLMSGWLVIFAQRSNQLPIAERTYTEEVTTSGGRQVTVIRA